MRPMTSHQTPASQTWSALAIVLFVAVMLFDGAYCWKRAIGRASIGFGEGWFVGLFFFKELIVSG